MRKMIMGLIIFSLLFAFGLSPAAAEKGPIKIGVLAPLTGPAAAIGRDMVDGFMMYIDEIGSQVAGRRIEVIVEDDLAKPAVSLTKARKLVLEDKVNVLAGALLASSCYALAPFVHKEKMPYLSLCAADDLTQRRPEPYLIRTSWSSSQNSHPFGEWVYKNTKIRTVATIGLDYAFGHEVIGGFQRTFEESGGKVIQKVWTPLGILDFAPYIAQLRRDADAVFALYFGAYSLRFAKQFEEAGLKGKMMVLGGGTFTDESALRYMGDEALGIMTSLHYSAALDIPANRHFFQEYRKLHKIIPSYYSEDMNTVARWAVAGIKAVDGNVEDTPKFLEALRKVKMPDSVKGPLELDNLNNIIQNTYIRKVERVKGELQNTVIATIPRVTQFWKYDPKEYMKEPVYSRDYPPCRYCK